MIHNKRKGMMQMELNMILRLVGSALVVAGSSGLGMSVCRDMESQVKELKLLARSFEMLKSEVGYSRATLPEGFCRVGGKLGGSAGAFFCTVGERMKGKYGAGLETAWKEPAEIFLKGSCLKKKEKELLLSFPEFTGYIDGRMQLAALEDYVQELRDYEKAAETEKNGRKKAVLSVSMAGGLLTVILLL